MNSPVHLRYERSLRHTGALRAFTDVSVAEYRVLDNSYTVDNIVYSLRTLYRVRDATDSAVDTEDYRVGGIIGDELRSCSRVWLLAKSSGSWPSGRKSTLTFMPSPWIRSLLRRAAFTPASSPS